MPRNGVIDLSELYFEALKVDEYGDEMDPLAPSLLPRPNGGVQQQQQQQQQQTTTTIQHSNNVEDTSTTNRTVKESFLDIAVFEVPERCTSRTCDLSRYGVGKLEHFAGATYLNLCHGGRLNINPDLYHGYRTQLMVPQEGPMPHKLRNAKVIVPVASRNYEVMVANCNDAGRRVRLQGQVVFDFDANPAMQLDATSLTVLTLIAFAVCMFFSVISIRIRWGRGSGGEYVVVNITDINTNSAATNADSPNINSGSPVPYRDSNDNNNDDEGRFNVQINERDSRYNSSFDYPGDGIELEEFDTSFDDNSSFDEEDDLRLHMVPIV
jgi:hypothetical protein